MISITRQQHSLLLLVLTSSLTHSHIFSIACSFLLPRALIFTPGNRLHSFHIPPVLNLEILGVSRLFATLGLLGFCCLFHPITYLCVFVSRDNRSHCEISKKRNKGMNSIWVSVLVAFACLRWVDGFEDLNGTDFISEKYSFSANPPLMVALTLIQGARAKGAVCLDGTLPGYHLHRGYGSGSNSWLIQLEGGGWCNNLRTCVYRKKTRRGSSNYMEKQIPFTGILSNKAVDNPDFFNWNRVKVRYCDGASFSGEGQNKAAQLIFRGERIWFAAMEDLKSKGMRYANQALLSGCSAGGLASILHCDKFRALFPRTTKVKCLADAGMFLDALDVSGRRTLRSLFAGVVGFQGVQRNLPRTCTSHMDPTSCFFPQNLVANVKTPLFLLNTAYDSWQVQASLAPPAADPHNYWHACKLNHATCSPGQIQFFQGFRNQMLSSVRGFSQSKQNGLFINSCFAHCQTERQDTWFADDSPVIRNKGIAQAVGDWYFDRSEVKMIDCPYPCDRTCHNLVFK